MKVKFAAIRRKINKFSGIKKDIILTTPLYNLIDEL